MRLPTTLSFMAAVLTLSLWNEVPTWGAVPAPLQEQASLTQPLGYSGAPPVECVRR